MIERTISQSMYDNAPIEHAKKLEEVKEAIYKENIDNLTCRMTRKKANGTWTEIDQIAYEKADAHCKELIAIEEAKPIFNPDEKLVVVSDEEYERQLKEIEDARIKALEEEEAKRKAEQTAPQIEAPAKKKTMAKNTK